MAALVKTLATRGSLMKLSSCLGAQSPKYITTWNKDWKPGPYPKTEAERIAAAKKYGLSPEEYEPYPDDGTGYGDYPKLPIVSGDAKDPYYNYDFPELRRDFGETLHIDHDVYTEERVTTVKQRWTNKQMVGSFLLVMTAAWGLYFLFETEPLRVNFRRIDKQLPKEGVVHYTFEVEN